MDAPGNVDTIQNGPRRKRPVEHPGMVSSATRFIAGVATSGTSGTTRGNPGSRAAGIRDARLLETGLNSGRRNMERSFPQMLTIAREAKGWDQGVLADQAGFDPSYIHRLENGKRSPTREAVLELAAALDLDEAGEGFLLMGAGYTPERPALETFLYQVFKLILKGEIRWDALLAGFVIEPSSPERSIRSTSGVTLNAWKPSPELLARSDRPIPVIPGRDLEENGTRRESSS